MRGALKQIQNLISTYVVSIVRNAHSAPKVIMGYPYEYTYQDMNTEYIVRTMNACSILVKLLRKFVIIFVAVFDSQSITPFTFIK